MDFREIWNRLYPDNLFTKDDDSVFQKWLMAIAKPFNDYADQADLVKANHIIDLFDQETIIIWELLLDIPENLALTTTQRRARIKAYLAGTQGTVEDIKNVVAEAMGVPYSIISLIPRKISMPSGNITNNYTYDIIVTISPSLVTYDPVELRRSIERIHPIHCILGDIYVFVDFLTLDTSGESLDNPDYVLAI